MFIDWLNVATPFALYEVLVVNSTDVTEVNAGINDDVWHSGNEHGTRVMTASAFQHWRIRDREADDQIGGRLRA